MKLIQSGSFSDPDLGTVRLAARANSTRLTARWKNGELHVSAPAGLTLRRFTELFSEWRPALLAKKPAPPQSVPSRFDFELLSVIIERRPVDRPLVITASHAGDHAPNPHDPAAPVYILALPDHDCPARRQAPAVISRMLDHVASLHAHVISPELTAELSRTGLLHKVRKIAISRGHSTLGRCSSNGTIAISRAVIFLPLRLRRLIYCHEIAHLTEMNHSDRFHRLLDSYLAGTEKALSRELRAFRWPWRQ